LLQIEAVTVPGAKGKVTQTGNLKDIMKESIQVAEMLIKSRALSFGIRPDVFDSIGIHVHVPEGATPKDGPSAGLAMVTGIVSSLTGIPVKKDVAMTGEVDLLGQALQIGGLKEKLLAALHGGITKVLIPKENVKDLAEIPDNVKTGLEIVPVTTITEVLSHALTRMPTPIEDKPVEVVKPATPTPEGGAIHH
jgi:ATP-dependent Lon protease